MTLPSPLYQLAGSRSPLIRDEGRQTSEIVDASLLPQRGALTRSTTARGRRWTRPQGRRMRARPPMNLFGHVISMPALFGQLLIGLINGSFYALLSLGLAVIFGMLNIVNFAHGAFYMMGAFAAYFLLDPDRPQLLVCADPVAADHRRGRGGGRAAVPQAARRLRSALQPLAHLRPGARLPGPVPELFRRLRHALRHPE